MIYTTNGIPDIIYNQINDKSAMDNYIAYKKKLEKDLKAKKDIAEEVKDTIETALDEIFKEFKF